MDDQPWPTAVHRMDAPQDRKKLSIDADLDLLLPQALAPVIAIEDSDRARLQDIIGEAMEAFAQHYPECRARLEALLVAMEKPVCDPATIDLDGLPLSSFHATDYDRYFRVNRIEASQPAHALLRSFLQVVHAVTDLFCRTPELSEAAAKAQFDGFRVQARLLARCFGVECTQ